MSTEPSPPRLSPGISAEWRRDEPYYPVNDEANQSLYRKYAELAAKERTIFGGRLAEYKYYDMDKVIESALQRLRKSLRDGESKA